LRQQEKRKKLNGTYEPAVSVANKKKASDKIEITVKDNGTGIPRKSSRKVKSSTLSPPNLSEAERV